MKTSNSTVLKYFIEFLIVASGVVLGILITNWNDDRYETKNLDKTRSYLLEELKSNISALEKSLAYHEGLKASFDTIRYSITEEQLYQDYIERDALKIYQIPGFKGPGFAALERSVYESAIISGTLQKIDITQMQLITKAYKIQENYDELSEKLMTRLFNINSQTKVIDMIGFIEILNTDVYFFEKSMIETLKSSITELEGRN